MSRSGGVLVPVGPSATLEETVSYAVGVVRDVGGGTVHIVRTVPGHHVSDDALERDQQILERAERLAREAADGEISVRTDLLGIGRYIADPAEHVDLLVDHVREHDLDRIILDPDYSVDATAPSLQPIDSVISTADVEYERVSVSKRDLRPTREGVIRGGVLFGLTVAFYLALGGLGSTFTYASAVGTGILVAVLFRNVAFETTPHLFPAMGVVARSALFVPYLLWEIAKANVLFAYVVLHPSMPIDPGMDRVDAAVSDGLSVTTFANSITLTPGTLTVDAIGNHLLVHSLTPGARDDLVDGVHERAVRYLFYGRDGLKLPGPGARGDADALSGPAASGSDRGDVDD
ncbi:monovalent cation/H+ antiporter subunit E [Natrialbaceae archaeon AArc-T1-2]|uniref:monovalent cation/H+ antiporter subunit E n=1 Tax=Natrialbaceae archaeon AArc-T1-2 TaxID=3053904 RepID=UPI00255B2FC1|nr:monovalent cation/H+ antiporter subunit E [Natrialbaceae archaeon AArc-T1-2]WIV66197.1 monovalent cation/H+ antiporter subunit E [Natrialbaceae archaeon AArc-T1-2]